MMQLIGRHVSKIAIAAVLGGLTVASYAYAADYAPGSTDPQSGAMMDKDSGPAMKQEDGKKRVNERIKMLHDKLSLNPSQEAQWNKVAQVMRENEERIHRVIAAREENENTNAVDDLKSYQKVAEAHEEGLKRLVPAFEKLYRKLSPEQKATADDLFRSYEGRKGGAGASPNAPVMDNQNAAPANEDAPENNNAAPNENAPQDNTNQNNSAPETK